MPGNVGPGAPTEVMPWALCAAFTEELRYEAYVDSYMDGSSDRAALMSNPRHFFRMTQRLKPTQYTSLFNFYKAHLTKAFWFYSVFETPGFTYDPTGANPVGRYCVVFDGSFNDQISLARSQASFGLREVYTS
ncbi:MAG TPA: hypothetical protein VFV58_39220 [Blastocatellia bacterium]|nr:hypothetical protein [Blastocatellia bacterium]